MPKLARLYLAEHVAQGLTSLWCYGSLNVFPKGKKANHATVNCGTKGKENWTDVPDEEADPPHWSGFSD
jgi:hypothetical protein